LNERINNFETQQLLKVSRQDAYKKLRSLLDLDLLEKKRGSRSTYYILKNVPEFVMRKD
jgi:Fic family protein